MEIKLRTKRDVPTVETPLLQRTINRTLNVHHSWPFVVWSGPAGAGKSETARYLVKCLDVTYLQDPDRAFRACHFEIPEDPGGPNAGKRFLRIVHHRVIGRLTDGEARALSQDDLAEQIAEGCEQRGIQLLLVDEAGLITLQACRALCLLRSQVESRGWPLTVVLIGMDDLPKTVKRSPQVKRRVHEWCFFQPYSFADTWDFVAAIHPHFATLDRGNEEHAAQVAFLHEKLGGLPGHIVPFLQKVDAHLADGLRTSIDLTLLRAAQQLTDGDEERATKAWKDGWVPKTGSDVEDPSGTASAAGSRKSPKLKALTGASASPGAARGARTGRRS